MKQRHADLNKTVAGNDGPQDTAHPPDRLLKCPRGSQTLGYARRLPHDAHPLLPPGGRRLVQPYLFCADAGASGCVAGDKSGKHVLIAAPTGSGKTLAAFLAAIDDLVREGEQFGLPDETRIVYVSPLKALSNDINRTSKRRWPAFATSCRAREPRCRYSHLGAYGRHAAVRAHPDAKEAAAHRGHDAGVALHPAWLAIGSRNVGTTRTVIVDEIHAVAGSKRGSHLSYRWSVWKR